jgi:O-Antigen ligase
MSELVLVPCLICLLFVLRGRVETAFLSVYLPTALLFPQSFSIRIPHMPELSISELAVIPLGILALIRLAKKGGLVPMDFLVAAFWISLTVTEVLNEQDTKDGLCIAAISFCSMFLTYAVGRSLIEPELRLPTVRRIVLIVLLLGIPGIFEWRMGHNLYAPLGKIFGVGMSPSIQLRGGHGRFSAAFTDSEIAGIAVGMTAALNAWLAYLWRTRSWERPGKLFAALEKYHIAGILLLFYVFLTQSRGPELALMVGYLILQIPRFKNTRSATAIIAILIVAGGLAAYQTFSHQMDLAETYGAQSEQQASALYRRRMLELFQPILEQGGLTGWGYKSIPHAAGLGNLGNGVQSIDNEFLYVNLAQGTVGYILFLLIAAESVRTLVLRSWRFNALEDRAFAFSLLAAMAILWIALSTVYMGDQLPQVAFLLIGWGQSIVPGSARSTAVQESVAPARFAFRRVVC